MAFTSTISFSMGANMTVGAKKMAWGTYANASGSTGGNIDTGLKVVESMSLQPKGTAVIATAAVINETLPCDGSAVTIVTAADENGTWQAIGY